MKYYNLYSAVDNEAAYADLQQTDAGIDDFIVYDEGGYRQQAVFIAQEGYTPDNISQTDFIQTIPKMPLFSESFVHKLAGHLEQELAFFPAVLKIRNVELKCFLGKIKPSLALVDFEQSDFYEIDGERFIDYPPVFLEHAGGFEYCAKEDSDNLVWVFTEKFKELVLANNLNIAFLPV